jgi:hypothetical protein
MRFRGLILVAGACFDTVETLAMIDLLVAA